MALAPPPASGVSFAVGLPGTVGKHKYGVLLHPAQRSKKHDYLEWQSVPSMKSWMQALA
jgi:hypothetical protein